MTSPRTTPNPATESRPERSSQKVARKKPLAWLPWALLGLLAALLGLVLLVVNAIDDDGPDGAAGDQLGQINSNGSGINGQNGRGQIAGTETGSQPSAQQPSAQQPSAQQPSAQQPSAAQPSGAAGTAPTAAAGAGAPELRVGDQDLLRLAGGSLTGTTGQPMTGTARVESVVSDEGFWVGSSTTDRVFVHLTPQARKANGESPFQVRAGQSVQLRGQLVPVASNPAPLRDVTDREGLGQIQQQGAYVNADDVRLAD